MAQGQQILNGAIDPAIISFDLEGRITSWSEGARHILGWTEAEMLGAPADRIFTPEDVAGGRPALERDEALRTGRGRDERWHVRADGSRVFTQGEMMVLRAGTGAASGFIKTLRDRGGQRRVDRPLRGSQDWAAAALGTGLVGFFDWDVAAGLVRADERFATLHGLDAARLAEGMPLSQVLAAVHPEDRVSAERLSATLAGRGEYTRQFRVVPGAGKARSVLMRGRCYEWDGKQALRFTGIVIDISAALDAQEALRASEAFNRQVLASSPDCIKVLDLDGTLRFMSEGGLRAMEIDDFAAFKGCHWPDFCHGYERGALQAALATARAGGRGHFQGYADTVKGNRRYWDVVVTPMLDAGGRPDRLLAISRDVTEARAAGERIGLALDTGVVLGTWVWDVARDQLTGDARFADTFGLDPEALTTGLALRAAAAAIHPDDLAQVAERVGQAVSRGGPYRAEYRVRRPDGSWRWIEANGHCELDPAGEPTRFPGILIDIDSRKRQELRQAALIELGDHLRGLSHPAAIAAAASQVLGAALQVSRAGYGSVDAAREVIEIEPDWCAGPGIASVAGRHAFRDFGSYIDDLKRNEVVAIPDVRQDPRTGAGVARLGALQIRALLNVPLMKDGRLAAVVLAHTDAEHPWTEEEVAFARAVADRTWAAMEQARAGAELQRINETLEQQVARRTQERDGIWNASQDLLGVADAHGVWLSVNPAWTDKLGWSREEILGRTSEWLEHPEDRAATHVAVIRLAGGSRVADFENRFRTRNGGYRSFSWVAVPVEGKLFCSARDITEQKLAAERLARAEEALRQSQKMEAVGQLTGGVAHDFNNLLTGITGSLELMSLRIGQGRISELEHYVAAAQGAARRAAALTHRLLAFSRRQTLAPSPTNINRLVAGMEELIRRTVGPEIEVEVVGAAGLWPALIDANQLENALLNLCINARDAMPEGGRITIETANRWLDEQAIREQDLAPGQYLSLCVTDTGTGMAPEVIERAFDPFFTTKPLGQGTGLGLSMIYGFVRQSGGQVRIYSEPGQGTTMCLYLPRHHGPGEESARPDLPSAAPGAGKGETVLVVDDEATIRQLISEVLEELGYAVLEAEDGAGGLGILQSDARIDLLVTDVGLTGGMNGRQMADAARLARPDLKVLFITGYAENAVMGSRPLEAGMHVLTKPFAMDILAHRVTTLIAGG
ncbi:PAS domain S-box protein [Teichococcus aestuarii]|uniref:PAS domain S-box protein n=1 Tax=Teichococcus aestuarii TaxID=568898 RepID=UPI00360ADB8D